jgi:hypothetical protein
MDIAKWLLSFLTTISAFLSGIFWMRAATVKVLARSQEVGVGYGGVPVNVRNEKGEVLDFLETYPLQSKWNSRAALMSALTAAFAGLYFFLTLLKL